ncbi:uncharacterized protein LOC123548780 [Mercenaria mercenaria]|uniref:uncharacterized protein LOC123548780 n=1 Tax=Mercenaria mercenaria TaxID=6596 RepID=UPI00234EB974|nr:uncharacterized protein LOC123548780 [Mercenaria mercenaria]
MSENRHGSVQENSQNGQTQTRNLHVNHMTQENQSESRYHVLIYNQNNRAPQNAAETTSGRAYTIVQLGQHFNLQMANQSNPNAAFHNSNNFTDSPLNNQSTGNNYFENQAKFSSTNHLQVNHTTNTTNESFNSQSGKNLVVNAGGQSVSNIATMLTRNQLTSSTTQYLNQSNVISSRYPGNQSVNTTVLYTGNKFSGAATPNAGNQTVNTITQYPGNLSVNTTQYPGSLSVNTSTQHNIIGNQSACTSTPYHGNQTVNKSTQYSISQTVPTTTQYSGKQTVDTCTQYPGNQSTHTSIQYGNQNVNMTTFYTGNQTSNLSSSAATHYSGSQTVNATTQYPGSHSLHTTARYPDNQSHSSSSQFQENLSMEDRNIQQDKEHSLQIEQKGEESQSLLCSETFTSPTPPSDDCGWTQPGTSVIWTHCENSGQETAFRNLGKSLLSNAVKNHGPLSIEQFHSKIGKSDKGELLKAALLGETLQSEKLDTEYFKRDINSNFQSKCADDKLKFGGNDVDSGWRMSGSNGYDRNRMTGSSTGGTNNNISLLSDGSSTQSHTQPQVASAEGMLLGRIGGTGGVALHDIGSRSIVAGTAGAGPHVTLASVFRPPQSVPETGRYGTAFTTAAGSSAVGPYNSPLYATGSHGTGLGPYSAFYSQYPNYSAGVMHGTLDPQYGSYSAVLQSMGSHAAQSQVPRSPYGGSGGTGAAGVLNQYSLHMPRTTSPGGKTFIANTNIGTHERDDSKYRREMELDKRRYSTGVIKDEKPHHFSVPSGFPEPARVSFPSTLRESPSQGRDPQDYYKVPSGREGSLKHRILRPSDSTSSVPLGNPQHSAFTNTDEPFAKRTKSESLGVDKEFNRQGLRTADSSQPSIEVSQSRTPHLHYPPHFMKGSIIQLGNGEYKRVEDLETDDFRHSADVSSDLKIDSSTVVHIEENEAQGTAVLGFVVGEHKIQVTVEATVEHPFFVFGQGWSSCEPAWTMKRYGLECHKLSVGDVCISLTHKEVTAHAAEISQQQKQQSLEDTYVFDKDRKQMESVQQIQRDSPGQGQSHRNRSPNNSQSPTIQGQSYRSEAGQYSESSTAPVKGEHLFSLSVSSQIPSSSQTQEQRSLPSTTS